MIWFWRNQKHNTTVMKKQKKCVDKVKKILVRSLNKKKKDEFIY